MKKGLLIFSDMLWVFIFALAAALTFLLLFLTLKGDLAESITTQELPSAAQFIAGSLPRMTAVHEGQNVEFSVVAAALYKKLQEPQYTTDPNKIRETDEYRAYVVALENIFSNNVLYAYSADRGGHPLNEYKRSDYTIFIGTATDPSFATCVTFNEQGKQEGFCTESVQPQTGSRFGPTIATDRHIDKGYVHLPTADGPFTLYVVVTEKRA
jgi:hypothetical protein